MMRKSQEHVGNIKTLAISLGTLVFVLSQGFGRAEAQQSILAPNASVRGDIARLQQLPVFLEGRACATDHCSFPIKPIHLTVALSGAPSVRVVFTEAEDTRTIRRETELQSINDVRERPILLQGISYHRHTAEGGGVTTLPATGTIYRDNGELELEVSISGANHRAPERLGVLRAFLNDSSLGGSARGRAGRPSSRAFQQLTCGTHQTAMGANRALKGTSNAPIHVQAPTKVLYIGTDFDAQFMRSARCKTASRCNNHILSLVNQASAHYQRQLGTRLRVERQRGPVRFTSGTQDSGGMISNYSLFIESNYLGYLHDGNNSSSKLADGFAGFTGQKMANNVIGIATLGVYCNNSASLSANMVVQHVSSSIGPLVIAHELGHNLSAEHSSSGIMAASVSKMGRLHRFASASVSQVSNYLNDWFSECRGGAGFTPPPGSGGSTSSLQLSVGPADGYNFSLGYTLTGPKAGCYVRVRAGESATEADTGVIILERNQTSSGGFTTSMNISSTIDTSVPSEATVYFKAFYVCSGEQVRANSEVESYVAQYDESDSNSVSRLAWILDLKDSLNY